MTQDENRNNDLQPDAAGDGFIEALLDHWENQSSLVVNMFFRETIPGEINTFLAQQKAEGNRWVAYDARASVLTTGDLHCFPSVFAAQEFCYEHNTDRDLYTCDSARSIEHKLEKWQQLETNVPDIIQLTEAKMKQADWFYANADSYQVFAAGEKETGAIKHLLLLIRKEVGLVQAQQLWDKYVPANAVAKPDFLNNIKNEVMTEQEMSLVEKQFMKIGLKEAFTPELADKLKSGVPSIEHPFRKSYDGDEANAVLHLKKSETSDQYFFNKYNLSVRKEGQAGEMKQTFHLNNFKRKPDDEHAAKFYTTFTFKEAYNYLSGRPVWKNFKNANDQEYNAWAVANLKSIQNNGSPEQKQYNQNYPFNIEKVLGNYSITELANETYKQRLLESLQRGNLQLVTFIGHDKQKEKLYISPNIPLNAMRVYDGKRQVVPTQTLVEKGFIGNAFAEKLKESIEQIKQKNGSETPQKQAPVQETKGVEKEGLAKEEKEGESVGKEKKQRQTNKQTQKPEGEKQQPKQRQRQRIK